MHKISQHDISCPLIPFDKIHRVEKNDSYLLREVRLRILASVTTGNCGSGVRDLWGEGLCVAVREKGGCGSSKVLLLPPASSLAGSESARLAGDAEGALNVIQSVFI